eukprot:8716503-Pyramimonas_sp.AAC.1
MKPALQSGARFGTSGIAEMRPALQREQHFEKATSAENEDASLDIAWLGDALKWGGFCGPDNQRIDTEC